MNTRLIYRASYYNGDSLAFLHEPCICGKMSARDSSFVLLPLACSPQIETAGVGRSADHIRVVYR